MRLLPVDHHKEKVVGVELDCASEVAATTVAMDNGFTATHAAPPTIATPDFFGGRWTMTHTAVANQLMVVASTNEIFQFVQGRPIRFICDLQPGLTAQTPEELNLFAGCMNAFTTAPCVDAGAGPKATGDHFGFYTPEAGGAAFTAAEDNFWMARSQHNGTAMATVLDAAHSHDGQDHLAYDATSGDGIAHRLIAEFAPTNAVPGVGGVAATIFDAEIRFEMDGVLVAKHLHRGTNQITIASTTLMQGGLACLNTAAASIMNLDYMKCEQLRSRTW